MDPTTPVGHQISDVDSLNCSSEESLSHNQPQLLRVFFLNVICISLPEWHKNGFILCTVLRWWQDSKKGAKQQDVD